MEAIKAKMAELWSAVRASKSIEPTVKMYNICDKLILEVRQLITIFDIEIYSELDRANSLYPTFHSPHEGYAVILEEVEEFLENPCKEEAIQVCAMAQKFKEMWNEN